MASSAREFAKELVQALIKWTALEVSSLTEEDVIEPLIGARDAEIAREARREEAIWWNENHGAQHDGNWKVRARKRLAALDPPAPAAASAPEVTGNSGYDDSDY
jgi:hypothetical protein